MNRKHRLLPAAIALATLGPSMEGMAAESIEWSLDGSARLRYESLQNAYRSGAEGDDQILVSQILASLKMQGEHLRGEVELLDARAWMDDDGTPLGTDDVNTLEPLQVWVGWETDDVLVKVGRLTFDIGSRRFMARQRFRNTMNAFDGVYARFGQESWTWQAFYVMPVDRMPSDRDELDDNKAELDERSDDKFWGLHATHSSQLELFYFGLEEEGDGAKLNTFGFRHLESPKAEQLYHEVEAAYQTGENGDLDVKASMLHAHMGYQFSDALSSRVEVMGDYASGDDDPNDGESNRFNTLNGVTRFDFGPTGIYGAFARTNLVSPGVKWAFKASKPVSAFISYRAVWLDSAKDSQSRSGLRDTSGDSGTFVGHQIETRWRIKVAQQTQLELGGAWLKKGEFFKGAPNAPDTGDTTYAYTQIAYKF